MTNTRSFVERVTPSKVSPLFKAVAIVIFVVVAATQLSLTSNPEEALSTYSFVAKLSAAKPLLSLYPLGTVTVPVPCGVNVIFLLLYKKFCPGPITFILNKKDSLPDIILLDLNMPKINGIEFLEKLKNDDRLRYIPVIVLTTSGNHRDLLECYKIGVAGYVLKPLKYEDYVFKMEKLLSYWSINELITL